MCIVEIRIDNIVTYLTSPGRAAVGHDQGVPDEEDHNLSVTMVTIVTMQLLFFLKVS